MATYSTCNTIILGFWTCAFPLAADNQLGAGAAKLRPNCKLINVPALLETISSEFQLINECIIAMTFNL